ncbi:flagellar filament capping protein FliD [Vibrio alginolyticus]|uniref:flagellar filament capping protein FliD n=1 Tax=Vibrio alginolyticus TaxID=663 RepID=UPI0006CA6876|nr:flagellar filament capping protein FliD [Vibrio alginolyticus]KPM98589.1 hypothetical protein AOG25_09135 [Vibrio alginolyticus]CAH7157680.1 Flagellar hook-associated protein fliD [Vibrio chagasii]CAH7327317.1 Flagellar hook-associated protein fliD [Vibrio chagasii]
MNQFSISGSNSGMLVSKNHYMEAHSNRNQGASIVDSALSNKDMGFSVQDNVDLMVSSKMGMQIPEKQSEITNANVRKGAVTQLQKTMEVFSKNTIKPLDQRNSLVSYEISNTNPQAASVAISPSGLDSNVDISLGVDQLAQSQSLKTSGYPSGHTFDSGSLTFDFGSYSGGTFTSDTDFSQVTVSVTDGDDLNTVASKINAETKDIRAMVVKNDDGTEGLALISQKTGESNSMRIMATGSSLNGFEFKGVATPSVTIEQEPKDAVYRVNGIEMRSESNNIEDLIGLSVTLKEVTANDLKITSKTSPQAVTENVNAFVENYNSVVEMANHMSSEYPSEDFGGAMFNTKVMEELENELDEAFKRLSVDGIGLRDIGVTKLPDGRLALDQDKLNKALENDPEIAFKVLGTETKTSHSSISVDELGLLPSGEHNIVIERAPEKALMSGTKISTPVTLASDVSLPLTLGGVEVDVTLPSGTYSGDELANKINLALKSDGVTSYSAKMTNGSLTLESAEYGSLKSIEVKADVAELGLVASKETGVDVSGSINGERFLGDGNSVESKFDELTKGFKFKVDPETLKLNEPVTVSVSRGVLSNLESSFKQVDESFKKELKEIGDKLDDGNTNSLVSQLGELEKKEEYYYGVYYQQYSGVSAKLAQMNNVSEMLDMLYNNKDE